MCILSFVAMDTKQQTPKKNSDLIPLHTSVSPEVGQAVPNTMMQQPKTPVPQSPAPANQSIRHSSSVSTPSPQMPQSPDPVHDLPPELLDAGWRQFWSKREGRNYYFNKFTQKSLWEMPTLGDRGASRVRGKDVHKTVHAFPAQSSLSKDNWTQTWPLKCPPKKSPVSGHRSASKLVRERTLFLNINLLSFFCANLWNMWHMYYITRLLEPDQISHT